MSAKPKPAAAKPNKPANKPTGKLATVQAYIDALPEDRKAAIQAVRAVILKNLDKDYVEVLSYGMIGYAVPHSVFPAGYHCDPKQPLPFAGLASQKGHMSLYLMGLYIGRDGDQAENEHTRWFRAAWEKTGKKLDMGKACIRFKKLDDVPLEVIGEAIRRMPARDYIEAYERTLAQGKSKAARGASKTSAKPAAKGKPATAKRKPAAKAR